jgi:hypothetical protein
MQHLAQREQLTHQCSHCHFSTGLLHADSSITDEADVPPLRMASSLSAAQRRFDLAQRMSVV